jgi:curved DNA-binding protein CbpA
LAKQFKGEDPLYYYGSLNLAPKSSIKAINSNFMKISSNLKSELKTANCLTNEEGEWLPEQVTAVCKRLKEDLAYVTEARLVLANPQSKRIYDEAAEAPKDYYAILKVGRSATAVELKQNYMNLRIELDKRSAHCTATDRSNNQECIAFQAQQEDLEEAYAVLGDTNNRQLYQGEGKGAESLNFVSSPLQMVTSGSPTHYMLPILVVLAVMYYLSRENQRLNPAEFDPRGTPADIGEEEEDSIASANDTAGTDNKSTTNNESTRQPLDTNNQKKKR